MKKSNRRITNDEIALKLGLTINECKQYRLNEEQVEKLQELTHYIGLKKKVYLGL